MSKWKRTSVLSEGRFETREDGGVPTIEGYFAVFNEPYWQWNDAFETIDPGAFDLEVDKDVRALTNHDTTLVLGRTSAGTLSLRVDEKGLRGSVLINRNDQDAMNLYERVKRGDVSQCSFGFDILDDRAERRDDGIIVFHLRKVKLYEVSVCTFPAYEATGVEARQAEAETIRARYEEERRREERQRLEEWKTSMRARIHREAFNLNPAEAGEQPAEPEKG